MKTTMKMNESEFVNALMANPATRQILVEALRANIPAMLHPNTLHELRENVTFQNAIGREAAKYSRSFGAGCDSSMSPTLKQAVEKYKRLLAKEVLENFSSHTMNNLETRMTRSLDKAANDLEQKMSDYIEREVMKRLKAKIEQALA